MYDLDEADWLQEIVGRQREAAMHWRGERDPIEEQAELADIVQATSGWIWVAVVVIAIMMVIAGMAQARSAKPALPGRPGTPIVRPIPGLPGQPVRRFAENWQELLCVAVAWSVSPTLPPATQKLYLGECPPRQQAGQLPVVR